MPIKRIVTGMIEENCYLLWKEEQLLIIDPGAYGDLLIEEIEQIKAQPLAILLTHAHFDHIGAVDQLRDFYQIPVYVSPLEQAWLQDPTKNLSVRFGEAITARSADLLFEKENYQIGAFSFKVIPTPGHSIGSVSFIFDEFVVVGDTLFQGGIGRTDFPTGDLKQLLASIQMQLFTLPEKFPVYPGHGYPTTIAVEKTTNPFFRN